jgi:hypothetical protein
MGQSHAKQQPSFAIPKCSDLADSFDNPASEPDFTFVFPSRTVQVHKLLLKQSEVFRAMLGSSMEEASSNKCVVDTTQDDEEIFIIMLRSLYQTIKVSQDKCVKLLLMADKYQILNLIKNCSQNVKNFVVSENCLAIWNSLPAGDQYKQVTDHIETVIVKYADELIQSDKYVIIEERAIFDRFLEVAVPSYQIASVAMKWMRHDPTNRMKYLEHYMDFCSKPLIRGTVFSQLVDFKAPYRKEVSFIVTENSNIW